MSLVVISPRLAGSAKRNRYAVPANAVSLQIALTLVLIVTSTFDSIIIFSGAILTFNSLFDGAGRMGVTGTGTRAQATFSCALIPAAIVGIWCVGALDPSTLTGTASV